MKKTNKSDEKQKIVKEHIIRVATLLDRPVSVKDIDEHWSICNFQGDIVPVGMASQWVVKVSRETIKGRIYDLLNEGRMQKLSRSKSSEMYQIIKK